MTRKTGLHVSELVDLMRADIAMAEHSGWVSCARARAASREVLLSKEVRYALAMYLQKRF